MNAVAHYAPVTKPANSRAKASPPKATRTQITITVNTHFLDRLEAIGGEVGRNRSEMIDRAIEEYVLARQRAGDDAGN